MQENSAQLLKTLLTPLRPVLDEVVLVGGSAIPLWIDDPGAPPARATNDTDVLIAVNSRAKYYSFADRLRGMKFSEDPTSNVICRWKYTPTGAIYDVMPLDDSILGFSNEWYPQAFRGANAVVLPGGTVINVATPPFLIATKLVAFSDRGRGDYIGSHDIHDIMALLDGRNDLAEEVAASDGVGAWIASRFQDWISANKVDDAILNYLPYDAPPGASARLRSIIVRIAAQS